jgi:hydrogenase maturation factor
MRDTLDEIGAVLVGGHTEVTAAVTRPVIVGQMLGMAQRGRLVTTGGAQPDDAVVQIGPVPIEGAAVLASEAGTRLGGLDPLVLRAAAAAIDSPGVCVVEAALAAAELGATALHDPTEGGLAAGLHELAHAGRVAVRIDAQAIAWFAPGLAVCRALDADPWATLASGAVIATFPRGDAAAAVVALGQRGHTASIIGVIEPGAGVLDNAGGAIPWPERDEVARILSS